MRKKLLLLSVLAVLFPAVRAQSLEECRQAAEQNYPIIRQYDLIARTTELTVRNIQKAWFPQISVTAQGSYQNKVTAWPENLQGMFAQMGIQLQGLSRDQYKVGIDVRQTLFDGGTIGSRREIARGEGAVQAAQTEVDLYKIGQRVHEMYFGLLLLDEQLRLNADANALLRSNEQQLAAMLKSGTASAGDFENVKAERLSAEQQQTELFVATANAATPAESFLWDPGRQHSPACRAQSAVGREQTPGASPLRPPTSTHRCARKSPRRPTLAATWALCTRLLRQSRPESLRRHDET